jgi:hypothetical protein
MIKDSTQNNHIRVEFYSKFFVNNNITKSVIPAKSMFSPSLIFATIPKPCGFEAATQLRASYQKCVAASSRWLLSGWGWLYL